jgi:hypothetical protein
MKLVKNIYRGKIVKIKDTYIHYPSLRGKYGVVKGDVYVLEENELDVEILKNYEKGNAGEREGTFSINIDFLEFIKPLKEKKKGGNMPRILRFFFYLALVVFVWRIVNSVPIEKIISKFIGG